jgi:hypothetical protein
MVVGGERVLAAAERGDLRFERAARAGEVRIEARELSFGKRRSASDRQLLSPNSGAPRRPLVAVLVTSTSS